MLGLRLIRVASGQSQHEVGHAVGTSQTKISQIERGQRRGSRDLRRALARYFDVDERLLFGSSCAELGEFIAQKFPR